jgi:hypothetical protein
VFFLFETNMTGSSDATAQAAVIGDGAPCSVSSQDDDHEIQFLKSYLDACTLSHDNQNEGEYNEQFLTNYLDKMQFKYGHYYAPLPWKDDHPELKTNLDACYRHRLQQVTVVQHQSPHPPCESYTLADPHEFNITVTAF